MAAMRSAFLSITSQQNGALPDQEIRLLRPPVVLIHGIWSSSATWDYFTPLVIVTASGKPTPLTDGRFNLYCVDYSQNASDHISHIESMPGGTFDQLAEDLKKFKTNNSVAAVQSDIVAHSMGGLVARDMITDVRFFADSNFYRGNIHKLITIGTPHNGTPLADNLLASSTECHLALSGFGHTIGGAVQDLALNNPLLTLLSAPQPLPIEAHAIVGIADDSQQSDSYLGFIGLTWGASLALQTNVCIGVLPTGGYQQLFGGDSDLLVSRASQSFGFPNTAFEAYNGMIHTVTTALYPTGPDELNRVLSGTFGSSIVSPSPPTIPLRVIQLLNTPVTQSSSFALIEP